MKHITLLISLLITSTLNAQVAIGTSTPAPGTMLHIADATGTSGVLFPKVSIPNLSLVSPLPSGSQDGTIVYNTNILTGVGYYFLKNSRWEPIFGTVGVMSKFTNSLFGATSTNLNAGGTPLAQICGNTYFNDNNTVYTTPSPTTLRVLAAGRYKVIVNLSLVGYAASPSGRLLAVEARLRINGTNIGGVYRSNEMLSANSTTPDYSSITFTEIVNLAAGNELTVRVNQTQNNGNVYLESANNSSIFLERLN